MEGRVGFVIPRGQMLSLSFLANLSFHFGETSASRVESAVRESHNRVSLASLCFTKGVLLDYLLYYGRGPYFSGFPCPTSFPGSCWRAVLVIIQQDRSVPCHVYLACGLCGSLLTHARLPPVKSLTPGLGYFDCSISCTQFSTHPRVFCHAVHA